MFTFKNFRNVYRHGKTHSALTKIMADLLGKAIAGGIGGNVINSFTNGTNSNSVAELKS